MIIVIQHRLHCFFLDPNVALRELTGKHVIIAPLQTQQWTLTKWKRMKLLHGRDV